MKKAWPARRPEKDGKPFTISLYSRANCVLAEMAFRFDFAQGFQDEVSGWIKSQPQKTP